MARLTAEDRVQRLEDIHEITLLKGRYLNAADGGWGKQKSHNGSIVATLFAKDGTWTAEGFPGAKGPAEIRKLFKAFQKNLPIAMHISANPLIKVKGDTAVGEWHLICNYGDQQGKDGSAALHYVDKFVRTSRGWRFQSLSCSFFFNGPLSDGWTRLVNDMKAASAPKKRRTAKRGR